MLFTPFLSLLPMLFHPLSPPFPSPVLASTDDVVHPLLFACETKNPAIVKISLSSLQKLIQYNAIPQVQYIYIQHVHTICYTEHVLSTMH